MIGQNLQPISPCFLDHPSPRHTVQLNVLPPPTSFSPSLPIEILCVFQALAQILPLPQNLSFFPSPRSINHYFLFAYTQLSNSIISVCYLPFSTCFLFSIINSLSAGDMSHSSIYPVITGIVFCK